VLTALLIRMSPALPFTPLLAPWLRLDSVNTPGYLYIACATGAKLRTDGATVWQYVYFDVWYGNVNTPLMKYVCISFL